MQLAISTFNNRVTQSISLIDDASFQFVDVQDLGTIDLLLINVKIRNKFSMIFWSHSDFLSQHTVPIVEFIVVNVQTMTAVFNKVVQQQY